MALHPFQLGSGIPDVTKEKPYNPKTAGGDVDPTSALLHSRGPRIWPIKPSRKVRWKAPMPPFSEKPPK